VHDLSDILGEKPFYLGETPSECDCTVYSILKALIDDSDVLPNNPLNEVLFKNCGNLVRFVRRIDDMYLLSSPCTASPVPRQCDLISGSSRREENFSESFKQ
jgi:hypothetical protein